MYMFKRGFSDRKALQYKTTLQNMTTFKQQLSKYLNKIAYNNHYDYRALGRAYIRCMCCLCWSFMLTALINTFIG